MEEAAELANYLSLSFKTRSEQDYIAFLWDASETNYTYGRQPLAFLACHMLAMSTVWSLSRHFRDIRLVTGKINH